MYPTTVRDNRVIGPDVHELRLARPEGFTYRAGQFIVLQGEVDGKPVRRSYSLASAPHEEELRVAVKSQPQGRFSPFLCGLKKGDALSLLGPFGNFVIDDDGPRAYFAAGTGIAPFRSFLLDQETRRGEDPVVLVHSARSPAALLYHEELSSLEAPLTIHATVTRPDETDEEWDGPTGRIDAETLRMIPDLLERDCYLCGPTPMVVAVKELLLASGVPKERIHTEKFGDIRA